MKTLTSLSEFPAELLHYISEFLDSDKDLLSLAYTSYTLGYKLLGIYLIREEPQVQIALGKNFGLYLTAKGEVYKLEKSQYLITLKAQDPQNLVKPSTKPFYTVSQLFLVNQYYFNSQHQAMLVQNRGTSTSHNHISCGHESRISQVIPGPYGVVFKTHDNVLFYHDPHALSDLPAETVAGQKIAFPQDTVIQTITAGKFNAAFLTSDKRLFVMGDNGFEQLGILSGGGNITLPTELKPPGNSPFKKVFLFDSYAFYITEDEEVYACGENTWGRLGVGPDHKSPCLFAKVSLPANTSIQTIQTHSSFTENRYYTLFRAENSVYIAGRYSKDSYPVPVDVKLISKAKSINKSKQNYHALFSTGKVQLPTRAKMLKAALNHFPSPDKHLLKLALQLSACNKLDYQKFLEQCQFTIANLSSLEALHDLIFLVTGKVYSPQLHKPTELELDTDIREIISEWMRQKFLLLQETDAQTAKSTIRRLAKILKIDEPQNTRASAKCVLQ